MLIQWASKYLVIKCSSIILPQLTKKYQKRSWPKYCKCDEGLSNAVAAQSIFMANTRGWNCLFAPFAQSMRRIPNTMMMVTWEKTRKKKGYFSLSKFKEKQKKTMREERQRQRIHVLYLSISCQSGFQKICKTAKKRCNETTFMHTSDFFFTLLSFFLLQISQDYLPYICAFRLLSS